jgi:hypothetical protein
MREHGFLCRSPVRGMTVIADRKQMLYALLIYGSEDVAAEQQASVTECDSSDEDPTLMLDAQLLPTTTAVTLRCMLKTVVLDGPWAHTKEELLGLNVIEARNLNDAIAWALRTPAVVACEVRPISSLAGV